MHFLTKKIYEGVLKENAIIETRQCSPVIQVKMRLKIPSEAKNTCDDDID